MNWFNLDDPVEAIALSKSQKGRRGVSTSRAAHPAGRHGIGAAPAPADNPSCS
jgi:hypothetical protein